jgi:hypothetical protein
MKIDRTIPLQSIGRLKFKEMRHFMQLKLLLYYRHSKGPLQLVRRTGSTHLPCPIVRQPLERTPKLVHRLARPSIGPESHPWDHSPVCAPLAPTLAFIPSYLFRLHLLVDFVTRFCRATDARGVGTALAIRDIRRHSSEAFTVGTGMLDFAQRSSSNNEICR